MLSKKAMVAARPTMVALALGAAGGTIGYLVGLPLPWIMGAMILTTIVSLSGRRFGIPKWLEFVMAAILGTMVGSAFTPNSFDGVGKWTFSIAAVVLFTIATTILIAAILKKWGGFGPITSFFASAPGNVTNIILIGRAMGGGTTEPSLSSIARDY